MTEKVGLIKNPLTIIAIFAGIAEVSGTIVLPFVAERNQVLFIWFLIIFPSVLVVSFFLTLNFNNKVLYAPSDYRDEGNYLLSNRYNDITQSNILVKESYNEAFLNLEKSFTSLKSQVSLMEESRLSVKEVSVKEKHEVVEAISAKAIYTYKVMSGFSNVNNFVRKMATLDYEFEIYESFLTMNEEAIVFSKSNQSIWLGINVDLPVAKEDVFNAKKYFPFIKYIALVDKGDAPRHTLNEVFIGGSTESAVGMFNLNPIDKAGFEKIDKAQSTHELHQILNEYVKYHDEI